MTYNEKGDHALLGRTVFHYSVNLMNASHATEVFLDPDMHSANIYPVSSKCQA